MGGVALHCGATRGMKFQNVGRMADDLKCLMPGVLLSHHGIDFFHILKSLPAELMRKSFFIFLEAFEMLFLSKLELQSQNLVGTVVKPAKL